MLFKLHFINIIVVVISIILCTVVPPFEQAHWYTTIFHLFCVILQNHVLLSVLPFHYISCFGPTSYTLIHMNALFMWSLTNKDTYIKHIKIFPHSHVHRWFITNSYTFTFSRVHIIQANPRYTWNEVYPIQPTLHIEWISLHIYHCHDVTCANREKSWDVELHMRSQFGLKWILREKVRRMKSIQQ